MKQILQTTHAKKAFTAALILLLTFCGSKSFAQLSGIKTIPGDYATIADAIADLNANGVVAPGVTFNIAAGYSELWDLNTSPGINTIGNVTGTASSPVIFKKNGAGADPLINVLGTSGGDAGITIVSSSYITIDGIDITDNGTGDADWVEYGILITDNVVGFAPAVGSQHNTIRHCKIILSANDNWSDPTEWLASDPLQLYTTVGINQLDYGLDFNPSTITDISQTNSFNSYYSNTIVNAGVGFNLNCPGFAGFSDIYDTNNDIGTLGGNTISGSGLLEAQGIYEYYQTVSRIANNTINLSSTQPAFNNINGIYISNNAGVTLGAITEIDHNTITVSSTGDLSANGASGFNGIDLADGSGINSSESYNVHNNTVQNCVADYRNFNGINNGSSATPANIYNNEITNCSSVNTPGGLTVTGVKSGEFGSVTNIYNNQINTLSSNGGATIYGVNIGGAPDFTSLVYNNFISNLTTSGTSIYGISISTFNSFSLYYNSIYLNQTTGVDPSLATYGIYSTNDNSSPITVTNNLVVNTSTPGSGGSGLAVALSLNGGTSSFDGYDPTSDHNDYYAGTPGAKNLIFQGNTPTVTYQDLSSFIAASATDANSISANPGFNSQTDLHSTHMTNSAPLVAGIPSGTVTTDIDGNNRDITTSDIGADEFGTCVVLGSVSNPTGSTSKCSGAGTSVYTVPAVSGVNSYTWSVTGGSNSISAAPNSNTATVTWDPVFSGHATVSVVAKNLCHTSATASVSVNVKAVPSEIISFPAALPSPGDFGIAVDPSGNVFAADYNFGAIYKLTPAGVTTPFINNGSVAAPAGIATDASGNLYVTDQGYGIVDKIAPDGTISVAGDLSGAAAIVEGIAIDATGTNLYVTDRDGALVYQIDIATGTPSLLAGTGIPGNDGDGGPATSADISTTYTSLGTGLEEVAVDASGNVYIADPGNHRVRVVAGTTANGHVIGNIYNFAGSASGSSGNSGDGGLATAALLSTPTGVRVDATGNVYISDIDNHNVRVVSPNGIITTFVNTASTMGNTGDGGLAPAAELTTPYGLAVDASGNLYISDQGNTSIREVFAPLAPAIAVTPATVCPGGSTVYTATSSGASTYAWSITPGAGTISGTGIHGTVTWNPTYTGTATISVSSSNGCGSTPASSIDVTSSFPIGGQVAPIFSIICSDSTKPLIALGAAGNNLQWQISSDNVNWSNISGATSASYTTTPGDGHSNKFYRLLSKSSACGDVASTTAEVDISNPTIALSTSNITDNSVTVNWSPKGTGNYTISYSGTSSATQTSVTPAKTITGLSSSGTYTFVVTQTGVAGCPASGTITGVNTLCDMPTGVTLSSPANARILVSWTGPNANYRVYYRPLFAYGYYFTKDVSGATSALITKQGSNNIYGNDTYEVYVARLDCPTTGIVGQGTNPTNVTTLPALVCPTPAIDSVRSVCPVQLEVFIHPGSSPTNTYNIYIQRITPTILAVNSYGVAGSYFSINVPYPGEQYLIAIDSKCSSGSLSTLYVWPGNLTIKPLCKSPANLVLSNPACHGFTASWNADQCFSNTASQYALSIRQVGTINYNSYGQALQPGGLSPIKTVNWLTSGRSYQVFVRSAYNCSGSITYGPASQVLTIATLSSGCRDEEETGQPVEDKPAVEQYSPDNQEVFSLYPNPNSGEFMVALSRLTTEENNVRIEVMNMIGQTIATHLTTITGGQMNEFINLPNGTASGTYIVRLTAGKNVYTARVNISR